MKIYFTQQFKKDLSTPYKTLELTTFQLRSSINENIQLINPHSIKGIEESDSLYQDLSPSNKEYQKNYNITGIQEGKSIQLYFQIGPENNGLYDKDNNMYNLILVYYKNLTSSIPITNETDKKQLAFLLFENYEYTLNDCVKFKDLKITTRNFNVLFPVFRQDFYCTLNLRKSETLEYLEDNQISNSGEVFLKDVYEQSIVPELFNVTNTDDLDIISDIYINNLGLKIY